MATRMDQARNDAAYRRYRRENLRDKGASVAQRGVKNRHGESEATVRAFDRYKNTIPKTKVPAPKPKKGKKK